MIDAKKRNFQCSAKADFSTKIKKTFHKFSFKNEKYSLGTFYLILVKINFLP